ncbi:MAG: CHASE2 domain-containing protein, partial [Pseudohongiellaceae bacterium]
MAVLDTLKKVFKTFLYYLFKGYRFPVFLSLVSTVFVIWLYTANQPAISSLLARIDNLIYDQRLSLMLEPKPAADHKIVIVDYDQRSLNVEGHWPWSRFKIGDLVRQLTNYGVLVVGFDVFFPEYERNLAREARERFADEIAARDPQLLQELDSLSEMLDGDRYFAEQMGATDVVLGFSFRLNEELQNGILPEPIIHVDESLSERLALAEMQGYEGNVDILQEGARGAGFFDTMPDIDGVLRRTPLVLQYKNRLYPSLALEMARLYYFEDSFSLNTESDATGRFTSVTGIGMGPFSIPTDDRAQVLVAYAGPSGSYPYIYPTEVLR